MVRGLAPAPATSTPTAIHAEHEGKGKCRRKVTNQFPEVVDRLERADVRVVITKHGQPAAVVLSVEELDSLEETLAVLSSADLMSDIDAARVEHDADTATPVSKADAIAMLRDS